MVANLAGINAEITEEQKMREADIAQLTKEVKELEGERIENEKFIKKMNDFLTVD